LSGNWAEVGGAAYESTLYNCIVTGNSATHGGGANNSTLYNTTVTYNTAVRNPILYEDGSGGGVAGGALYNCIVYFNTAPSGPNFANGLDTIITTPTPFPPPSAPTFNFSCTTPLPAYGMNNIDADPQMATLTHLSTSSPCIGAGNSAYASGVDIDDEPWANPPCMGADQLTPDQATGPLTLAIEAEYTNVATEFGVRLAAQNQGHILSSVWDFDDGTVVSNQPVISHAWSAPGSYTVRLTGYNDSFPEGTTATVQIQVSEGVYYVDQGNPTPVFPYTSWATASTNIQDAIEAGTTIGRLVLVTNGVYGSGSVQAQGTNRMALTGPLVVRSVNGPAVTVIAGAPGIRCAYVGTNAILSGFTLTNGNARTGGGAWSEDSALLTNCILTGNSATSTTGAIGEGGGAYHGMLDNCTLSGNSASAYGGGAAYATLNGCTLWGNSAPQGAGGGAYEGTLYNCTLSNNATGGRGGGAAGGTLYNCILTGNSAMEGGGFTGGDYYDCEAPLGTLYNCTVTGNSAIDGGGVFGGTLYNCVVYFNTGGNFAAESVVCSTAGDTWEDFYPAIFNYSCTTPLPTNGVGNITNSPVFVDLSGDNLRLRSNSPCINAGHNAYVASGTDLDGNPRIVGGTVDMGAYEFQGSGSLISYAWLQQFGLPTDGSADAIDSDADDRTTFQEWQADTDPTNPLSYFHIEAFSKSSPATISFQSSSNRTYTLWGTPQLAPPEWTPVSGQQGIPGTGGTLILSDPANAPQRFYRVQVNLP